MKAPVTIPALDVLVIGSSTGGPSALGQLLGQLSSSFPAPIIIVQHLEEEFIQGFVQWLREVTDLEGDALQHGTVLQPGRFYVVRALGELAISRGGCAAYSPYSVRPRVAPNIDALFLSLACTELRGAAVLLTGMGEDGARGIALLSKAGWFTYVQSPECCAVDGMPSAALRLSNRHTVAAPMEIGQSLKMFSLAAKRRPYVHSL